MTDTATTDTPDGLEFVHSGIIRFHFSPDRMIRVRRPFLGELKAIRLALADVQDDLTTIATKVTIEGRALQEEASALNERLEAGTVEVDEHADLLADIRTRDRESARVMDDAREVGILSWWTEVVFAKLAVDPIPDRDEFPGWILDPTLPQKCMNHWRTVPAGPG